MKFAAFDLEIAKPVEGDDWKAQRPLGISCAAVAVSEQPRGWKHAEDGVLVWSDKPQLSGGGLNALVSNLAELASTGYTIVTWNGASFDFDILAEESGKHKLCAELALNHVDLMAIVVACKGHYLSLDKAAVGAGVPSKLKTVTLNDGTVYDQMNGADAPDLWAAGETDAVIEYLKQDARTTLSVAKAWQKTNRVEWRSNSHRRQRFNIPDMVAWSGKLPTVQQLLDWPGRHDVDTSWMSNPPSLDEMTAWATEKSLD